MRPIEDIMRVLDTMWREMPSPHDHDSPLYARLTGRPPLSYRARLDRQPKNVFGELIPRIVTVRHNLRRLKKPAKRPQLPA